MKNKKWLPLAILGATVLIVTLMILSRPQPERAAQTEKTWSVHVEIMQPQQAVPELALLGRVETPNLAQLTSAVVADVKQVLVREGQQVEVGQTLVSLDEVEMALVVQQREADAQELDALILAERNRHANDQAALANEQSLRDLAQREVERQQRLVKDKLASQERLDNAISNQQQRELTLKTRQLAIQDHTSRLRQLEARKARAESLLQKARLDLQRAQVRAPFAGTVTQVQVASGDRVAVGQPLVELYDHRQLEVRAQVPDRWVPLLRDALGSETPVTAQGEFGDRQVPLQLARLSGRTNVGAGGLDAFFAVTADEQAPALGRALNVRVYLPAQDQVFTAPIAALYGTDRIYLVDEGRLQMRTINLIGQYLDSEGRQRIIFAPEDIPAGAQVITTQLPQAMSGLKVETRQASP